MATTIQQGGNPATVTGPDGVAILIQPPSAIALPSVTAKRLAVVGTAPYGPTNALVQIGSGSDIGTNYGTTTTAVYDMPTDLNILIESGCSTLMAVRISDGTDTAAVFKIPDSSGFATDTLTVAGTFAAGITLTATITSATGQVVVVTYVTQTSDVNAHGVAVSFAAQINASLAVIGGSPFLQPVNAPAAAVITLVSLAYGTSQNAIGLVATGTGVTLTVGAATFANGAAPLFYAIFTARYTGSFAGGATMRVDNGSAWTSTSPTYKLTIAFPNYPNEIYDNIVGYATAGSGFAAATFIANLVAAVNGAPQLSTLRPQSANFIATSGSSSSSTGPVTKTVFAPTSAGTDGSTFAGGSSQADAAAVGSDIAVPKTGMFALSTYISGGIFWLAGNSDVSTIGQAQIALALRENAHVLLQLPTGTSTTAAIALKQSLGLSSPACTVVKDYSEFFDQISSITARRIPSLAFMGATYSNASIERSPANLPVAVLTGTERTGAVQQLPYNSDELYQLESAGINLITNPANGGPYFAIAHNKNSLGMNDPRGNIAYSLLTGYIAQTLGSGYTIGQFIGSAQSTKPGDRVRRRLKSVLDTTFKYWEHNNVIQASITKCNLQNNPPAQIQLGNLRADIFCQYLSINDRIVVNFTGGQTVSVQFQPTQLQSLPSAA